MRILLFFLIGLMISVSAHAQENVTVKKGITTLDPSTIFRPNRYAQGKVVPMGAQMLYTAGQVGSDENGVYLDGIEAQADRAFSNLYDVVTAAGMGPDNVLKINLFYLKRADIGVIMEARNRYFGDDFRPAQTALVVKSLAGPQILVEVEAIAAKVN